MIKKLVYSVVSACLVVCVVICGGCFGGKLAWVDATYTKMGGVSAKVVEADSKKAFILGKDNDKRIERFGELGELPQITVLVKGNVTKGGLKENTTPMTGAVNSSHVTSGNEKPDYYTDWIKLKIKLPNDKAVKINKLDGKGCLPIDKAQSIEDGYYYEKLEYVRGDSNKENYKVVSDLEAGDDNYLYYGFCDENNNTISEYFVHITYEFDIK